MRNIHFDSYKPAPVSLLTPAPMKKEDPDLQRKLKENAQKLEDVLKSFGINAQVVDIQHGASVTRFELTVERGTRLQRISHLQDEIMLELAVFSLRIEAPIPGKNRVGIEISNDKLDYVYLRELVETDEFRYSSPLTVPVGRDVAGNEIYCDLAKMPNLLVAGTIASGKSIWIYSMLASILVHSSPEDVRMILIDPKVVELSVYNGIPHLIRPVITDPEKAVCALKWTITEMQRRYRLFEAGGVRDIRQYNEKYKDDPQAEHLSQILIVIDELAELMSFFSKEVAACISRLAVMGRAAGIHMVIATQHPSPSVITGDIKVVIGSRIAFAVTSGVDSRTIIDSVGAEKLIGMGDMLYWPMSSPFPIRTQGAYVAESDVESVVDYLMKTYGSMYDEQAIKEMDCMADLDLVDAPNAIPYKDEELFVLAVELVLERGTASVSVLQRELAIGYPAAARLIDELEKEKIIGPYEGSKPRQVLITREEWDKRKGKG